ncbi:hypothetical protein HanPSC8_Chr10g0419081 [Helianthus annuus]|nr:hypothetical protein HanPSC8_Chr10g0419081 [Helianthus annuus]
MFRLVAWGSMEASVRVSCSGSGQTRLTRSTPESTRVNSWVKQSTTVNGSDQQDRLGQHKLTAVCNS